MNTLTLALLQCGVNENEVRKTHYRTGEQRRETEFVNTPGGAESADSPSSPETPLEPLPRLQRSPGEANSSQRVDHQLPRYFERRHLHEQRRAAALHFRALWEGLDAGAITLYRLGPLDDPRLTPQAYVLLAAVATAAEMAGVALDASHAQLGALLARFDLARRRPRRKTSSPARSSRPRPEPIGRASAREWVRKLRAWGWIDPALHLDPANAAAHPHLVGKLSQQANTYKPGPRLRDHLARLHAVRAGASARKAAWGRKPSVAGGSPPPPANGFASVPSGSVEPEGVQQPCTSASTRRRVPGGEGAGCAGEASGGPGGPPHLGGSAAPAGPAERRPAAPAGEACEGTGCGRTAAGGGAETSRQRAQDDPGTHGRPPAPAHPTRAERIARAAADRDRGRAAALRGVAEVGRLYNLGAPTDEIAAAALAALRAMAGGAK